MPKIEFELIRESNLYGYESSRNGRRVQVVRAYDDDWCVFAWIDGLTCKKHPDEPAAPMMKPQAMQHAKRILSGKITPEVWGPPCRGEYCSGCGAPDCGANASRF